MTIELYEHPYSPFCRAVRLVASLLDIPLEKKFVNMVENEQLRPEFLEKNPFHKVPVINDNGFYLSESRAIAGYLVDKYSPDNALYPKDIEKRALIDQMLFFDCGSLEPILIETVRSVTFEEEFSAPDVCDKLREIIKTLDLILGKRKFVALDTLTIADIAIRATLTFNDLINYVDLSNFKNLTTWMKNVREETSPAYGEINDLIMEEFAEAIKIKPEESVMLNYQVNLSDV